MTARESRTRIGESRKPGDRPSDSGQFDYGQDCSLESGQAEAHIGACPNLVVDPVSAARFMTAASTS